MRLPVLMIIISYLILILSGALIYADLRLFSNKKGKKGKGSGWSKLFLLFEILVLIVLTVAICMPRRSASEDITAVMWLLYIVLTVSFSQIIYCVFSILGLITLLFRRKRLNTGLYLGLPLALLIFCLMWWGALVGRNQIETTYVEVISPNLPESFNGYKIAQISDLHVGTWGNDTTFLSKLVDSVNNLKPDLIVFTGDIVNRHSAELKPFLSVLSGLKAKDGVLSVLGNHDYGDYISWNSPEDKINNLESLKSMQRSMGWRLLDNTYAPIINESGDSIIIIGVGNWGEPPFSQYGDLERAYPKKLNDGQFKILLSHNPEHWNQEVSKISNIDLTLAGHTHAMQFMISLGSWKWSPAQYKYTQWAGLYAKKNGKSDVRIYVNRGAGEVGFPMRLGATPEITLFTLTNK